MHGNVLKHDYKEFFFKSDIAQSNFKYPLWSQQVKNLWLGRAAIDLCARAQGQA